MSGVDLVQWLGEQLDEDERIARAASGEEWGAIVPSQPFVIFDVAAHRANRTLTYMGRLAAVEKAEDRAHIAAHDPARVLREIEAKRRVVNLHGPVRSPQPDGITNLDCSSCGGEGKLSPSWPCPTIRSLAAVYVGSPGFREEWAL